MLDAAMKAPPAPVPPVPPVSPRPDRPFCAAIGQQSGSSRAANRDVDMCAVDRRTFLLGLRCGGCAGCAARGGAAQGARLPWAECAGTRGGAGTRRRRARGLRRAAHGHDGTGGHGQYLPRVERRLLLLCAWGVMLGCVVLCSFVTCALIFGLVFVSCCRSGRGGADGSYVLIR